MGGELMNEVEEYVCVGECERELCERAAALYRNCVKSCVREEEETVKYYMVRERCK